MGDKFAVRTKHYYRMNILCVAANGKWRAQADRLAGRFLTTEIFNVPTTTGKVLHEESSLANQSERCKVFTAFASDSRMRKEFQFRAAAENGELVFGAFVTARRRPMAVYSSGVLVDVK